MGSIHSAIRMSGEERKMKRKEEGERRDTEDCTLNTDVKKRRREIKLELLTMERRRQKHDEGRNLR